MPAPSDPTSAPPPRLRVADPGKRLLALIVDIFFFLLLLRTLEQALRPEHWDLRPVGTPMQEALALYGPLLLLLFIRDLWKGRGLGKFLFGLAVRETQALTKPANVFSAFYRNLTLLVAPLEGVWLLWDIYKKRGYGQRLGDRWAETVVVEVPDPLHVLRRLLLANIILFAFFALSWFHLNESSTRKTAALQTVEQELRTRPELAAALSEHPKLLDPELQLDLRVEEGGVSYVRVRIGNPEEEDSGVVVTTQLRLQEAPELHWEVVQVDPPVPAKEVER